MSKITLTVCDGCRETLKRPEEVALAVTMPVKDNITLHYCWACAEPIFDVINKVSEKKDGGK